MPDYVSRAETDILDEPATARALAHYLQRGYACGPVDEAELVTGLGLDAAALEVLARPHSDTESLRRHQ